LSSAIREARIAFGNDLTGMETWGGGLLTLRDEKHKIQYVIIISFRLQQWLHERASILRYTYVQRLSCSTRILMLLTSFAALLLFRSNFCA